MYGKLRAWASLQLIAESLSLQLLEAVIYRALAADIKELRLAVSTEQARMVDLCAANGSELAPELNMATRIREICLQWWNK